MCRRAQVEGPGRLLSIEVKLVNQLVEIADVDVGAETAGVSPDLVGRPGMRVESAC